MTALSAQELLHTVRNITFVTAHSESTTLGVRQAKRPRAQVFSEDPILLPEIVDQIVLVTVHPVLPSSSVGEESLSPNHPDTSSRF